MTDFEVNWSSEEEVFNNSEGNFEDLEEEEERTNLDLEDELNAIFSNYTRLLDSLRQEAIHYGYTSNEDED